MNDNFKGRKMQKEFTLTLVTAAFEETMGFTAITTDELFFVSGGQGMGDATGGLGDRIPPRDVLPIGGQGGSASGTK